MNAFAKKEKQKNLFNRGHFTPGTVIEYKVDTGSAIIATVEGVICNGPNSWLVQTTDICPLLKRDGIDDADAKKAINITWVTRIISRGTGRYRVIPCSKNDWKVFDRHYSELSMFQRKSKSTYTVTDLGTLVQYMIRNNPRYSSYKEDHIFNIDNLYADIGKKLQIKPFIKNGRTMWYGTVNKCRFHSVLKRLLAKHKRSRKAAQKEDNDFWEAQYTKDMEDSLLDW